MDSADSNAATVPSPAPRRAVPRMGVAGGLLSLIGWAANTASAARAAMLGPILLMVMAMDDSGRLWARVFSVSTLLRLVLPLVVGSCLVLAGNWLSGRKPLRCFIEAAAALIVPPVLAFAVSVAIIRLKH